MRQSYYNVSARLDDGQVAFYNTRKRSLVVLTGEEAACLENAQGAEALLDAPVLAALAEEGVLVDDPEAEADLMGYVHRSHRRNTRAFDLTISPTRACNCCCDYCYVDKRPGVMSEQVQQDIIGFLAHHYERAPFEKLKITWYGGEPLLAIDVMESLTAKLLAFCERKGVRYTAHALTNGILADAQMCRRLVENCKLATIMPTISGAGPMHDYQRPAHDGKEHFNELMDNIDCMLEAGLTVHANFVVNRNNFEECKMLAARLCKRPGVVPRVTRTFAYGREDMVLRDGRQTPLRLFERDEFAAYYAEFYRALGLDAAGWSEAMKPVCMYCAAWFERGYFIDEVGDVFACMIDMDIRERSLTNVCRLAVGDDTFNWGRVVELGNLEPTRSPQCRTCRVLPICQGGCACCRLQGDDVCHDLKDCIEDFVESYCHALLDS